MRPAADAEESGEKAERDAGEDQRAPRVFAFGVLVGDAAADHRDRGDDHDAREQ